MQSVVSYPDRGKWGNNKYRGNCSGYLIEDIIKQYHITSLSDFMVGGGTTEDVCKELNVSGTFLDLNRGYDMMNMDIPERSENIFWHPPYGDMITYSDSQYSASAIQAKYGFDPKVVDLSRCKDWEEFVNHMNYCMLKQFSSLEKGGRMFVLMGDMKKKGRLYSMLSDISKPGTLEQIVIKMQHNCTSSANTYSNNNFVPIVHEYVMVVRKDNPLIIPVEMVSRRILDMRNAINVTWRDTVHAVISQHGKMSLQELYEELAPYKKAKANPHFKEKIRQTVQNLKYFTRVAEGVYSAA